MSEGLKSVTAAEWFEEFYGLDGDGLGEGEVACEEELVLALSMLDGEERFQGWGLKFHLPRTLIR